MQIIKVTLPQARQFPGQLTLVLTNPNAQNDVVLAGPFPVLGKADQYAATQHGNVERSPLQEYGDTPTGTYVCTLDPAAVGPDALRSYGPHQRILLTGIAGPAAEAAEHRSGLMIHGGAPGPRGGLRPTHGCLRLSNDNMANLLALFKEPCHLICTELTSTSSVAPTGPQTGANSTTTPPSSSAGSANDGSQSAT